MKAMKKLFLLFPLLAAGCVLGRNGFTPLLKGKDGHIGKMVIEVDTLYGKGRTELYDVDTRVNPKGNNPLPPLPPPYPVVGTPLPPQPPFPGAVTNVTIFVQPDGQITVQPAR